MYCRAPKYLVIYANFAPQELLVPCGKCFSCLINRKRVWQTRVMLEADGYDYNSFVTLTYNKSFLPTMRLDDGRLVGTLCPRDLQLFFKRLRRYAPFYGIDYKIRYYAVGEYGDKRWRPHYHICLFGLGIQHTDLINKSWGKGMVHVGSLSPESSAYVLGYVEKKMTNPKDSRLLGRYPEFARSSNRFGIGFSYVSKLVKSLLPFKDQLIDVPVSIRLFGKLMPLGRYIRSKVRELLFGVVGAPMLVRDLARQRLESLKQEYFSDFPDDYGSFVDNFNFFLSAKFHNYYRDLEEKNKLYRLNFRRL